MTPARKVRLVRERNRLAETLARALLESGLS